MPFLVKSQENFEKNQETLVKGQEKVRKSQKKFLSLTCGNPD